MTRLGGALEDGLADALGSPVRRARPLSGGDINDAFELELEDGRRLFVKTNAAAPPSMFRAEARGLAWLSDARAIRLPRVVAVGEGSPSFLVLELIEPGPRHADFDAELGRAIAALHRASPGAFGLDHDNFIGSLPQSNLCHERWAEFFRSERLAPQLARAEASGRATGGMRRAFERLFSRLAELVGPDEPPARLHGDLWGGNLHVTPDGAPCLVDPAAYGGHREMDLAMMQLFGGFSPRVFAAYAESYPLAQGHAERVPLYQLYPLLVHVNLFGGSYVAAVERSLARYV